MWTEQETQNIVTCTSYNRLNKVPGKHLSCSLSDFSSALVLLMTCYTLRLRC